MCSWEARLQFIQRLHCRVSPPPHLNVNLFSWSVSFVSFSWTPELQLGIARHGHAKPVSSDNLARYKELLFGSWWQSDVTSWGDLISTTVTPPALRNIDSRSASYERMSKVWYSDVLFASENMEQCFATFFKYILNEAKIKITLTSKFSCPLKLF